MAAIPARDYIHDMPDPETPLRDQLDEAIARVRRELEILRSPSSIGGGSDDGAVIAELEAELHALHEARGHVGPHDT
jgi:hypothetical protein